MPEDRRLAAIMFTDIVGYTALMGRDEKKAFQMLRKNREIQRPLIKKYRGEWLKEIGDGILASFISASDAVRCASEIQLECQKEGISLRIGIHEGEVVFGGGDVLGDGVNVASRLEEMAEKGCVYVSGSVFKDIKNKEGITTEFIEEKTLKNVDDPVKIYKVHCDLSAEERLPVEDKIKRYGGAKYYYYILASIIVVLIAILIIWLINPFQDKIELEKSIAVLPFKYLSEDQSKQYLADGVLDAITGHLSKIEGLIVRPRTSVERYRGTQIPASVIGEELDVNYLIEGSFLMTENQVRLTIQLIIAKDEDHILFKEYDRDWEDIFAVQSEIAQTIAQEVAIAITPEVMKRIEIIPTTDLTAYDYYLQGNDFQQRSTYEADYRIAIQMYEKAVEIDSTFVLAWIGLAASSRQIYWYYYDRSEEQLARIKNYLDHAIKLSPNLKEVKIEEGSYYYHCNLNYPKALQILEPLLLEYPNDEDLNSMISFVYRRMGKFEKSFEYNKIAISINSSSWQAWVNAAITLQILRRYTEAEKYYKTSISLNPTNHITYRHLIKLYASTGQTKKAKEFLEKNHRFIDNPDIKLTQAYIEVLDNNFQEAIQIIGSISEPVINEQRYYHTKHLQLGLIYYLISNKKLASEHFEMERKFLLSKINKLKNDSRLYRSLGIAYAGLGMKEEAIKTGQRALELLSFSNDAHGGYWGEMEMVRILVMIGEYDDALTRLDQIISQNGNISVELLKLDPFWNPVRDMDKFKEIISNPKYQIELPAN